MAATLTFNGILDPGDQLVIDVEKRTVKLNGADVRSQIEGDFFALLPGGNAITYEDTEAARTVRLQVRHKDRWL